MDTQSIISALATLSQVHLTVSEDIVSVYIPAISDGVRLAANDVDRFRKIFSPMGDPAIELAVVVEDSEYPLILTDNDIIFSPASTRTVLDSAIHFKISNAPHLVTYSEMERDAERVALACENPTGLDLVKISGSFLLIRCFVVGVIRFGAWPVRTVAWWQRGLKALGGELFLPDFFHDATWDALAQDAASIVLQSKDWSASSKQYSPEELCIADFEILKPVMHVAQLDDEFLALWKKLIPISPRVFCEVLTRGMPHAAFEVFIYPDCSGGVDLKVQDNDTLHGLLQLRFSFPESVMNMDEIRVTETARGTGLFQKLIFNTQGLGSALGLAGLHFLATGIGAYALAKLGYPQDYELYKKVTQDQ